MHPHRPPIPSGQGFTSIASPVLRLVTPVLQPQGYRWQVDADGLALAHGALVLQPVEGALLALVPGWRPGPPTALPVTTGAAWTSVDGSPPGLAVAVRAGPMVDPQQLPGAARGGSGLDAWLARHAPQHRLATRARLADVLLTVWDDDGPSCAWLRQGDAWERLRRHAPWTLPDTPGSTAVGQWVPVAQCHLPGPGMQARRLSGRPDGNAAPAGPVPAVVGSTDTSEARHSRQALALGPAVLARLQALRIGLVGAGLEGSALASSLVRLGVDVCVLDPAETASHHLQADLAPWCEGQPKVRALRRQLDGLPVAGRQVDGRQLSVTSPAAGSLLAACDVLVAATAGPALAAAEAWALATLKPLLAIRADAAPQGCDAWLALLLPGTACLVCLGRWPAERLRSTDSPTPALRSWSVLVANMGLRLIEHLVAGRITGPLLRYLHNPDDGSLQVRDWRPTTPRQGCPRCQALSGAGLGAVAQGLNRAG